LLKNNTPKLCFVDDLIHTVGVKGYKTIIHHHGRYRGGRVC